MSPTHQAPSGAMQDPRTPRLDAPSFTRNPPRITAEARPRGAVPQYITDELQAGRLGFAVDTGCARELASGATVWRANLLGSSSKDNEYAVQQRPVQ